MRLAFFLFVTLSISAQEHRAIWVTRFTLLDDARVDALIRFADDHQLTDVFIQVRGRGDAFYQSEVVPNQVQPQKTDRNFRRLITGLKQRNIRTHAWINIFLLASSWKHVIDRPEHLLNRHRNWIDHHSDYISYQSEIENTAELKDNPDIEGLYALPVFAGLLQRYQAIVRELVDVYQVDGIHLDYFRLSQPRAGFHPKMRRMYTEKTGRSIEGKVLDYDHRRQWMTFVSQQFTQFLRNLRETRAAVQWSVAVKPNPDDARFKYGQDWADWLQKGLVNFVVSMNYVRDDRMYTVNVDTYRKRFPLKQVWVGVASYNQPLAKLQQRLKSLSRDSVNYSIFSFDNLFEKRHLKLRCRRIEEDN